MKEGSGREKRQRGYAEVITWGSKFQGGNGLKDQIRAKFKGGNIGHASVRLTIPADEKAAGLIEKYCYDNDQLVLPHAKKTLPNGDEIYEVYISAWSNDEVTLDRDFIMDSQEEREGVNFNWDPKWVDVVKPEKRSYKGLTSRTTMQLGPNSIIHQRGNLSDEQFKIYEQIENYKAQTKEITNYDFLMARLKRTGKSKKPKIGSTEKILLNRLLPDWKNNLSNPPKITEDEITNVISKIEEQKNQFQLTPEVKNVRHAIKEMAENELKEIQKNIQQDIKKWKKITPKTAEKIMANKELLKLEMDLNVSNITQYSVKDASQLYNNISMGLEIGLEYEQLKRHYENYLPSDDVILDASMSIGLPPDHVVQIPLESLENPRNDGALDIESMLKRAQQVATSHDKFSLTGTNCSKVAGWVLEAGAQGSKEGKVFNRKAMRTYATPQMVFNNANKYLNKISAKAKKNYNAEKISQLDTEAIQNADKNINNKLSNILNLKEISFDNVDQSLPEKEQCIALLVEFKDVLNNGDSIPTLSADVKLKIESVLQNDENEQHFFDLCEQAIIKANKMSSPQQSIKENEWGIVNELIKGVDQPCKISRKNHDNLDHSYAVLDIDGQMTPYRVSRDILGKGAEGKVKILENEQGERLAIKIMPDKKSLDGEIDLMMEVGAAKANFVRERESKESKSFGKIVGDKRYVVQPLHQGKEIQDLVKNKDNSLSDEQKLELAILCSKEIKALHEQNILHRDIKGANFMASINESGEVQNVNVIDFGGAIKSNEQGEVVAKPFGSPGYMAPELGREDILKLGRVWQQQNALARQFGSLISDASENIEILSKHKREISGEMHRQKENMYVVNPGNTTLFKKGSKENVYALLATYDGSNQEQVLQEALKFSSHEDFNGMVESAVNNYCEMTDQFNLIEKSIKEYEDEIAIFQQKRTTSLDKSKDQKKQLDEMFNKEVSNSFASDIYALGIMFKNEFGLDLENIGLSEILSDDANDRPSIDDIIVKLSERLGKDIEQEVKQSSNIKEQIEREMPLEAQFQQSLDSRSRLPNRVDSKSLHSSESGELSMLSASEMETLTKIREEKNNTYVKINNVTVFLSKEGGTFAMHSPISSGATGSTFLVQNLDNNSWDVMKMVKGPARKIRGQLSQLSTENKTLEGLGQLEGTMKMSAGADEMHISIQPFAHGKEYYDVMKSADNGMSIDQTVLMSLKALESLTDLHENHGYLHRDIKPENMMWDPDSQHCTIIDFGCAGKGKGDNKEIEDQTKRGTAQYQAPEIEFDKLMKVDRKYTEKTDIYSMGVVIKELLAVTETTQDPAFQQLKQLQAALTADNPELRPSAKKALKQLMEIALSMENQGKLSSEALMSSQAILDQLPSIPEPLKQDIESSSPDEKELLKSNTPASSKPSTVEVEQKNKSKASVLGADKGVPQQPEKPRGVTLGSHRSISFAYQTQVQNQQSNATKGELKEKIENKEEPRKKRGNTI